MSVLIEKILTCRRKFESGELQEKDFDDLLMHAEGEGQQSLLYIYARSNNPRSEAIGISILEEGKDPEGVDEEGDFLYGSPFEAMQDGWRIVKFPEMTLAMQDQNTYGLGYEFILERVRYGEAI